MAVWWSRQDNKARRKRVLIVGAGEAGALLLRDIERHSGRHFQVVGFVDDGAAKQGKDVDGAKVLGGTGDIDTLISDFGVDEVFVAAPPTEIDKIARILEECEQNSVPIRIFPSQVPRFRPSDVANIRKLEIGDLVGRNQSVPESDSNIRHAVHDRTVLVTGAGGSVGSQLCKVLADYQPKKLVLIDNSERALLAIRHRLAGIFSDASKADIMNVATGDTRRIQLIFDQYRPEYVFHTAPYEHAPITEIGPEEAVRTNVVGTRGLLEAALNCGTRYFSLVSTAMAAEPTNISEATERVAEYLTLANSGKEALKCTVIRLGDVLEREGSALALIGEQIKGGGPVEIAHPETTCHLISAREASRLILSTLAITDGGEVFVVGMGKPVKVLDLAKKMIAQSGLRIGRDINVKFAGPKSGEEGHEELLLPDEPPSPTSYPNVFRVEPVDAPPLGLEAEVKMLERWAMEGDSERIIHTISNMVPEFSKSADVTHPPIDNHMVSLVQGNAKSFGRGFDAGLDESSSSREEAALLMLVRAGLSRIDAATACNAFDKISWPVLLEKADYGRVTALIYFHLKPFLDLVEVPPDIAKRLAAAYYASAIRNEHFRQSVADVLRGLKDHDVPCLLLKGMALLPGVYNDSPIRSMADIDVLVRKEDLLTAEKIALLQGFRPMVESQSVSRLYHLHHHHLAPLQKTQNGVATMLEIHQDLAPLPAVLGFDIQEAWKESRRIDLDGAPAFSLCNEHMLVHLCVHGLFSEGKMTLGQMLDISLLVERFDNDIKWEYVSDMMVQSPAGNAIRMALTLVRDFTGAAIPGSVTWRGGKVSVSEKRLAKAIRRGLLDSTVKIPAPVAQLLLLRGVDKLRLARRVIFPHPLHQVDSATGASRRLGSGLKLARRCLPAMLSVLGDRRGGQHMAQQKRSKQRRTSRQTVKRFMDLTLALAAGVLVLPVVTGIALAIKVTSPGPILFKQLRVGQGGTTFLLLKFRTMTHGDHTSNTPLNPDGSLVISMAHDSLTTVGRLLRRLSFDEIPQLINVIRGDMSLVGPRPHQPFEMGLYDDEAERRLAVKPGITGLAQISGRNRLSFNQRLELDRQYIEGCSLGLDLRILALTPFAVISGKGVYEEEQVLGSE